MSTTWDPQQYLRFADERAQPFYDLIGRIGVDHPGSVVDLGCGPGNMTTVLAERWPGARVLGVDSSQEMIDRAVAGAAAPAGPAAGSAAAGGPAPSSWLEFRRGDLADWEPDAPVDVIVCNATLHWIPGHLALLPRFVAALAPGGCFAFQVPGNFGQPSHVLLRELALSDRWRDVLAGAVEGGPASAPPEEYLRVLLDSPGAGRVEVWETTYLHVLSGTDPVLNWVKGTGLRPVLEALRASSSAASEEDFLAAYAAVLRAAYPPDRSGRTIFPFRRIFGVAHRS